MKSSLVLLCSGVMSLMAFAEIKPVTAFDNLPESANPATVGKRVSENFIPRPFRFETMPDKAKHGMIYPEVMTWYGALVVADLTKDTELRDKLIQKFEPFLTEPLSKRINRINHVDYRIFGSLPLEIYLVNKQEKYKDLGLWFADAQWEKTTPDGITAEARYWIDDMYMIPLIQVQAYRVTKDIKYLDRAALAMTAYFDKLQQPNGLFFHGDNAHFYWGRGNGWIAAGGAELLSELPEDHPKREHLLECYRKMMAALLPIQMENGMWRQLLDKPNSWQETSATAMFAFGMVTGVKNGWLDEKTYGPAARKAWIALTSEIDENANLKGVCIGTDKGFTEEFYNDRPVTAGDLHGQAPILWTASALLKK